METIVVSAPDLGDAENVQLVELCVAVGDAVEEEQPLAVLESEKASMELPSPAAGVVREILIREGDPVHKGDALVKLEAAAPQTQSAEKPVAPEKDAEPASRQTIAVPVPDLGEAENVELIELCAAVGDAVEEEQSLAVLESEKASMELPSPAAGVVREILMQEGATVQQGDVILKLELIAAVAAPPAAATASSGAEPPAAEPPAPRTEPAPAPVSAPQLQTAASGGAVYAGPAVRKLAREFGINLQRVSASGARGRILKEDLHRYVRGALQGERGDAAIPALPDIDFSSFGAVEIRDMEKLHRAVAHNMLRSWLNVPHVTQFDEADVSALEELRAKLKPEAQKRGLKLTPLSFLLRAAAIALRAHPKINASLHADGRRVVYKNYVHTGFAVDTPAGLLVPVIRDVDRKDIWAVSREVMELAEKARQGGLSPQDMQGGCFTISSLGAIGGLGFTPVVNAPEAAILGVARLMQKPLAIDGQVAVRPVLPLSLSYDHRAVNGADAGRFFVGLMAALAQPESLLE